MQQVSHYDDRMTEGQGVDVTLIHYVYNKLIFEQIPFKNNTK